MGTPIAQIVTDNFMVEQQDIRLQEQAQQNPAAFLRRMWLYVANAIPRINRPPEAKEWLALETEPLYTDFYFISDTAYPSGTMIATGQTGYMLCSTGIASSDALGNPIYTPIANTYDAETGDVSVTESLAEGATVQCDFYTDGEFANTLDLELCRLLGLAMQTVWQSRFSSDWLRQSSKVKDKSFSVNAEANVIRADSERIGQLNKLLDAELRKYEQNISYRNYVSPSARLQNN